jgi:hypothetical protein
VVYYALSIKFEYEGSLFLLSLIVPYWLQFVRRKWIQDPKMFIFIQQLQTNSPVSLEYSWDNSKICYKVYLYLSKQSEHKSMVISELHATPRTGHSGFTKTSDRVKRSCFGDGMK